MSDLPLPPRPSRHWAEYIATAAALLISAVSLFVAIRTEDANNKMVAAASWPFLQINTSDGDPQGNMVLKFEMVNSGVGPALIESFEVFYRGKPVRSSHDLMQACCGYDPAKGMARDQPLVGGYQTGTVGNTVIRAGESRTFFTYPKTQANAKAFEALRAAVNGGQLASRACYCSVFHECYQGGFVGIHPQRVDRCVQPAVLYTQ
jgi:hypothetical protein